MATQKKIDTVNDLTDKVTKAKAIVFVDYRGIKHKQLEELRKTLKKTNGEVLVTKNRLLLRALGAALKNSEQAVHDVESYLSDTTMTLFAYADEVAPLRELLKFFKKIAVGRTKGGFLGTTVLDDARVTQLATLPSREILLATLVSQLNAPIQGLHYALSWNINTLVWALSAVKEKKTN